MKIKVLKKNPEGQVTYEYEGVLLGREANSITVEALFDREDMPFMDVVLKKGDRFVEYYYTDRWYNIFVIYDREDGHLKGWYCNIGKPAEIDGATVAYVDLALDLWVSAGGRRTVLDQDEFEGLGLNEELRQGALKGLQDLEEVFESNNPPH